jgi:hypothetical protein
VHREPKSNLPHQSDTAQAFRSADNATRSLESLGTTVSNPESQHKSGFDVVFWSERGRTDGVVARAFDGTRFHTGSGATGLAAFVACMDALARGFDATPTHPPITVVPRARDRATRDELHVEARVTATVTPGTSAAEWQADLEYVWRMRMADEIERLDARAARYRREMKQLAERDEDDYETSCTFTRQQRRRRQIAYFRRAKAAQWAEYRARALALPRAEIAKSCRKRWRSIRCGCGTVELPVGCDSPQLCAWCRKRHWKKWRHRITRSMEKHLKGSLRAWNRYRDGRMPPGIYLITLTGPHSGDIETDRNAMGEAWERLRKTAHAERWWKTYALTWEVTKGESGTPHVHAHVAVISSWIPYDELHVAWRRAMPGALVLDVQAPKRTRNASGRAANYLAKYVTKGIEPSELSGRKAGELLVAFRNRRKVTTSRHFWHREKRECPKCGQLHVQVGRPCSLQSIAPAAVMAAFAERVGFWIDRGVPQSELRWTPG